ncbi:MAG: EpsG family protein [Flavobacteriaceae bacterium]|nr:EpsG family protein [Flavobacteriaceae bacterium]
MLLLELVTRDYLQIYYAVLIAFFIVVFVLINTTQNKQRVLEVSYVFTVLFLLFSSFLWGLRPVHIGADTLGYMYKYVEYCQYQSIDELPIDLSSDIFFMFTQYLFSRYFSYTIFFLFISVFIHFSVYKVVALFVKKDKVYDIQIYFIFLFCALFSFPSLHSNILRNGLGVSFLLISLGYWYNSRILYSIFFGVMAVFFHKTTLIPIAILVFLSNVNIRRNILIVLYFMSALISFLKLGINNLPFIQSTEYDRARLYLDATVNYYRTGFRVDFFLFNTMFLLIFLFFRVRDKRLNILLNYYLIASSLFFLWFQIPFSDRIGLYSWLAIPIIFFYSMCHNFNRNKSLIVGGGVLMFIVVNSIIVLKN